ncbi:MAG: ketol-acid reductoisomerase [Sphingomonadaceae bacterium]
MPVHFDADADPSLARQRRVAIVGYGNQGRAQALNLRDSGVERIVIALPQDSRTRARAQEDGFPVAAAAEAAAGADLLMMLAPDEDQAAIYRAAVAPNLERGAALGFSHGLNIHFGMIEPRADLDVFLVAPKGPGSALRADYLAGEGMIALIAVAQDASGGAMALALSYGAALGCGRAGMIETSFGQESEADLFNEQGVLWGAVPELIHAGFETLVEAGYAPEIAYFECLTELKLLADLIDARGIAGMREAISNTAEFGAVQGSGRIVTEETRAEMRRILAEVRDGSFVKALIADARAGYPKLKSARERAKAHPIEEIGETLRALRRNSS